MRVVGGVTWQRALDGESALGEAVENVRCTYYAPPGDSGAGPGDIRWIGPALVALMVSLLLAPIALLGVLLLFVRAVWRRAGRPGAGS